MPCIFGRHCRKHDMVHGGEAEELRKGLEELIETWGDRVPEESIQGLLDRVDARDSLSFLEMTERVERTKKRRARKRGR